MAGSGDFKITLLFISNDSFFIITEEDAPPGDILGLHFSGICLSCSLLFHF
jgi:hypothetical protein